MRLSSKGRASFKLVNKSSSVWRGDVVLATTSKVRTAGRSRLRHLTFGRGSVVLAGGRTRKVGIQLSAANRKRVARLRRVRVSITLAPRGGTPFKAGDTILLPPRR
jgi:hypothetical protein